jgi:hypothetical protein
MATIPVGTKFLGVDPELTNLNEKKGTPIDKKTEYFTIEDLSATVGVGSQGPQGVQGPAGPIGPVGPAGLEWQGSWVSGTSYALNDAVGYDGASWFCISATSGTTTPNLATSNWALLASQGAQGIQGVQGPTGPQGPAGINSAKTVGEVIFGFGTINTLSFDINKIPTNGNSDGGLAYLPSTTGLSIGKEVTVACFSSGTFNVRTFDNSLKIINNNINPGSELSASIVKISNGEILKFTLIDNGFWILDYVVTSKENRVLYGLTGGPTALAPRTMNGSRISATTTGFYALPSSSSTVASNINEVTVYTQNATATIQSSTGGNISFTNNNSYVASYDILPYSTVRFTRYTGENWIAEPIVGAFPSFNGTPLNASTGFSINESIVNTTTSALSLSTLNSTYPTSGTINYPIGFKVYCASISGGGLVYIKTANNTWVSNSITSVV